MVDSFPFSEQKYELWICLNEAPCGRLSSKAPLAQYIVFTELRLLSKVVELTTTSLQYQINTMLFETYISGNE